MFESYEPVNDWIQVCVPTVGKIEKELVLKAMNEGWVGSAGPYIEEFEKKFAEYLDVKYAVSCTSGTAALQLALFSLNLSEGDEVIIPSGSMVATLNAVLHSGAKPVFVESDERTLNILVEGVERAISPDTKAVIAVHLFGHMSDMKGLKELCDAKGVILIEDSAQALGASQLGVPAGTWADYGCFSFFTNKMISTGEGGMLVTNDPDRAYRARKLRNHFFDPQGERSFIHEEAGFNFRMTSMQAALGLAQLSQIRQFIDHRQKVAAIYKDILSSEFVMPDVLPGHDPVTWMFQIRGVSNPAMAQKKLRERGIDSRRLFYPLHEQPLLKNVDFRVSGDLSAVAKSYDDGLYLPTSNNIDLGVVEFIGNRVREALRE